MNVSTITLKMLKEVNRLRVELSEEKCNVSMLIEALFAIRGVDENEYTNLFHEYFEKKLVIKQEVIDNALLALQNHQLKKEEKENPKQDQKLNNDSSLIQVFCPNALVLSLNVDEELRAVIEQAEKFAQDNSKEFITINYYIVALFQTDSKTFRKFLKMIHVNYMEAESFFSATNILGYEIVPYRISNFVRCPRLKDFEDGCDIVGREKEIEKAYRVWVKTSKRNVIFYGLPGVGKTAAAFKSEFLIVTKKCPDILKDFTIFILDIKNFVLDIQDAKDANRKINFLMEYLENCGKNIILVIDEIQLIVGKQSLFDPNKMDLSPILKEVLVGDKIRILGITTKQDYISYFESDRALMRRFEGIEIEEPKMKNILEIITPRVKKLEKAHKVVMSEELIDSAVWYAACFSFEQNNPDKTIDVVDRAMANANINNRSEVIRDDLIQVFDIIFKEWFESPYEKKWSTSVHESGHYVTSRLLPVGDQEVIAVTIYPSGKYGGVNIVEDIENANFTPNREYYIRCICCDLGGRIAEEIFFGKVEGDNAGALFDLQNANTTAKLMVTELGLTKKGTNRVYDIDEILGDEVGDLLDEEIDLILDEATRRTMKILTENKAYIEAIAKALIEQPIMKATELDAVWEHVEVPVKTESEINDQTSAVNPGKNSTQNQARRKSSKKRRRR